LDFDNKFQNLFQILCMFVFKQSQSLNCKSYFKREINKLIFRKKNLKFFKMQNQVPHYYFCKGYENFLTNAQRHFTKNYQLPQFFCCKTIGFVLLLIFLYTYAFLDHVQFLWINFLLKYTMYLKQILSIFTFKRFSKKNNLWNVLCNTFYKQQLYAFLFSINFVKQKIPWI
jgi:hypothetical protein